MKLEISNAIAKELFEEGYYNQKPMHGWQYVANTDEWDGGEERYNGYVFKNLETGVHIEIQNYYDSWDFNWDPIIKIVEPTEVLKTEYLNVKGSEVKITYDDETDDE